MRSFLTRPAALLTSLTLAITLGCTGVLPAAADQRAGQAQEELSTEYLSLSGALLAFYARQSGQTLQEYLKNQQIVLSTPALTDAQGRALPGQDADEVPGGDTVQATAAPEPGSLPDPAGLPEGVGAGLETPTLDTPAELTGGTLPEVSLPDQKALQVPALGSAKELAKALGPVAPVNATTLSGLNKTLSASGLTIDLKAYDSLDALARGVAAKSNTIDGSVALAGAKWVADLATLRTPSLTTPNAPAPTMPGLAKDSLVFGLFADKSLAKMITDSPDIFAAVGKSGVGTDAAARAWNAAMMGVYRDTNKDLAKVLPDPCTGGMLAVMASGDPAKVGDFGSGCSTACVTGGLYLNSQTKSMFTPGTSGVHSNPLSNVWNSGTLSDLQSWQKQVLLEQNPQLTSALLADNAPQASASCAAASTATSAALGATLPGIFNRLASK
jgi:hypothetical protein